MKLKKLLCYAALFFLMSPIHTYAEILYQDYQKKNMDHGLIPIEELAKGSSKKEKYLLASRKAYTDGDSALNAEGIQLLKQMAAEGITDARQTLYELSRETNGKEVSFEEGVDYLKDAAEDGYAVSQIDLSKVYRDGKIIPKDLNLSFYWAEKSANQGNASALTHISTCYYAGRGVAKNDKKGFEWLVKAYDMLGRDFENWGRLGLAYEYGRGTPINLVKAYMCYDLLGTAGIELKQRIAPQMTANERAEGLRLSSEWQEKNHVYTMQHLGLKRHQDGSYR